MISSGYIQTHNSSRFSLSKLLAYLTRFEIRRVNFECEFNLETNKASNKKNKPKESLPLTEHQLSDNYLDVMPLLVDLLASYQKNEEIKYPEELETSLLANLEQIASSLPLVMHYFHKNFFPLVADLKHALYTLADYELTDNLTKSIEAVADITNEYMVGHYAGQESLESIYDLIESKKNFESLKKKLLSINEIARNDNSAEADKAKLEELIVYVNKLVHFINISIDSFTLCHNKMLNMLSYSPTAKAKDIIHCLLDWLNTEGNALTSPKEKELLLLLPLYDYIQQMITDGFLESDDDKLDMKTSLQLVNFYDYLNKIEGLLCEITEGKIGFFIHDLLAYIKTFHDSFWALYNAPIQIQLSIPPDQIQDMHRHIDYVRSKKPDLFSRAISKSSFPALIQALLKDNYFCKAEQGSGAASAVLVDLFEPINVPEIDAIFDFLTSSSAVNFYLAKKTFFEFVNRYKSELQLDQQIAADNPIVELLQIFNFLAQPRNKPSSIRDLLDAKTLTTKLGVFLPSLKQKINEQGGLGAEQFVIDGQDLNQVLSHFITILDFDLEKAASPMSFPLNLFDELYNVLSLLANHASFKEEFERFPELVELLNKVSEIRALSQDPSISEVEKLRLTHKFLNSFITDINKIVSIATQFKVIPIQLVFEKSIELSHLLDDLLSTKIDKKVFVPAAVIAERALEIKHFALQNPELYLSLLAQLNAGSELMTGSELINKLIEYKPDFNDMLTPKVSVFKADTVLFDDAELDNNAEALNAYYLEAIKYLEEGEGARLVSAYLFKEHLTEEQVISIPYAFARVLEIEHLASKRDIKALPESTKELKRTFTDLYQKSGLPIALENALIIKTKGVEFHPDESYNNHHLAIERLKHIINQLGQDADFDLLNTPHVRRYLCNSLHLSAKSDPSLPAPLLELLYP